MKSGYDLEKVGLESGSLSRYLTKGLQTLGCKAMCIDSRKVAAILSATVNKTDKNDARGIADAMRCNHYKETCIRIRRAMVRPGRDRLKGIIQMDETFVGGKRSGKRGRGAEGKALVLIAAEETPKGIARIRLSQILMPRVKHLQKQPFKWLNPEALYALTGGRVQWSDKSWLHPSSLQP